MALWRSLEAQIERRGAAAVLADIERIAESLDADIAAAFNLPTSDVTFDPQLGGASSTSAIVRTSNELRDAQTGMRRAVTIARALTATSLESEGARR